MICHRSAVGQADGVAHNTLYTIHRLPGLDSAAPGTLNRHSAAATRCQSALKGDHQDSQ
jgi:hypothetical protein